MSTVLRPTYKRHGDFWVAVVKDEQDQTVWMCDHLHHNRDRGSRRCGRSAVECAKRELGRIGKGEDELGFIDGTAKWQRGSLVLERTPTPHDKETR